MAGKGFEGKGFVSVSEGQTRRRTMLRGAYHVTYAND